MKKTGLIAIFMAMAAIAISPSAFAMSDIELSVNTLQHPSDYLSTCPDRVIQDIEVVVSNMGAQTNGVSLTLDWPEDMGFIKPYVMLASGESARIDPFWITIPYDLQPGTYYATVTATSGVSGEKVSKTVRIEVINCHGVELKVINDYAQSCSETLQPGNYEFTLENKGTWAETFKLSASASWAELSDSMVTLQAGEKRILAATLNPPAGTGYQEVKITATSEESYASSSGILKIDLKDCYSSDVSIQPTEENVCLGDYADFGIVIKNTGTKSDTYSISVSEGWVAAGKSTVTIPVGESGIIDVVAAPDQVGTSMFTVTVKSLTDPGFIRTLTGAVNVDGCRGVAVVASPAETEVCAGETTEFIITVKNTGKKDGAFQLTSEMGSLDKASLQIAGGASADAKLTVNTAGMESGKTIVITASQDGVTDTAWVKINTKVCYSAELSIAPAAYSACPYTNIAYKISVKNTGQNQDSYTLTFNGETRSLSVNGGETATMDYDYAMPETGEGKYLFNVRLVSDHGVTMDRAAEIDVQPFLSCYSVDLRDSDGSVDVGKASVVELTLENKGQVRDTWTIRYTGPNWSYVEPKTVSLDPGKSEKVYLYISPTYGTENGEYDIRVFAESDRSSDELLMKAKVPGEAVPGNETQQPPTNQTGGDGITGQIIDRPFWKTAIVIIIALVIIAILVIRFAFYFKK